MHECIQTADCIVKAKRCDVEIDHGIHRILVGRPARVLACLFNCRHLVTENHPTPELETSGHPSARPKHGGTSRTAREAES